MLDLGKFHTGLVSYLLKMGLLSPFLLMMKAKLVSNDWVKQLFLHLFFRGMQEADFAKICKAYSDKRLPKLIRPAALATIKKHLSEGTTVVVVSASARHWLQYWCQEQNLQLICSELELVNGKITGKLSGPNCNGLQKAINIAQAFQLETFENIYAYGDSTGDKAMFELSTIHYYKPFR